MGSVIITISLASIIMMLFAISLSERYQSLFLLEERESSREKDAAASLMSEHPFSILQMFALVQSWGTFQLISYQKSYINQSFIE